MDVTRRQIFKLVECLFKDFHPLLGNKEADKSESQAIFYVLRSWFVLSFDCQCNSLAIMERWVDLIQRIRDFNQLVSVCKKYYMLIISINIYDTSISDFKDLITDYPFGRMFIKPIWHLIEHVFIRKDMSSLRLVLCWFKHITKAKIPNQTLKTESLDKWLTCEEDLTCLRLEENILIRHMQDYFARVFCNPPSKLEGFHGNGAVSEPHIKSFGDKYLQDGDLPIADTRNMIFSQPGLLQMEFLTFSNNKRSNQRLWSSRLEFVPKASDSMRSICMEPTALMYAEEGLRVQIEKLIRTNRLTKSNIFINDRTVNQSRAREASLSNNYATVDLSSASDLVSLQLIEMITRSCHPDWRHLLLTCRSTDVLLPNGSIHHLQKYAPMGSALCFPIETLTFASVCYATERISASYYNHYEVHDYVVFGDDIIVNSSLVPLLYLNLKYLGFKVNKDKSFTDGCFRESCGGDFYLGYNVTPQYNRLDLSKGRGRRFNGEFAAGLIGLANNALLAGYKHLRYFYINTLNDYYQRTKQHCQIGCTNDPKNTSKLLSLSPLYSIKSRYNRKLGGIEDKILIPHIHFSKVSNCDRFLLSQHLREMQYSQSDIWGISPHTFGMVNRSGRATVSYAPKWVLRDPKEEIW